MRLLLYQGYSSFHLSRGQMRGEPQNLLEFSTKVAHFLKESPLYHTKRNFFKDAKVLVYLIKAPVEVADALKTISKIKKEEAKINKFIYLLSLAVKAVRFFFKIIYASFENWSKPDISASDFDRNYLIGTLSYSFLSLPLKIIKIPKKMRPSDITAAVLLVATIVALCLKVTHPNLSKTFIAPLVFAQAGHKTLKIFTKNNSLWGTFSRKYANELS